MAKHLDFKNTKILGISQVSNFIGGDVFRLSTTQTFDIEGFIKVPNETGSSWDKVTQFNSNFNIIQDEMNKMKALFLANGEEDGKGFTEIKLNDVLIGNGRIVSLDFPSSQEMTENSLTFGKYNATIEIYAKSSSLDPEDGFADDIKIYDKASVAVIDLHAINIESFSENFTFNVAEDDAYNYSQEISINLRKSQDEDTANDFGVAVAQAIVSAILEQERRLNAKLGYIDDRYKEYIQKIEGTAYFSENYNEIKNEYTFSRNLSILPSYEAGGPGTDGKFYSAKITHAMSMNNSGIFKIVESGEVKGMKGHSSDSRYTSAKNGMDILIADAPDRCEFIYDKYRFDDSKVLSDQGYETFTESINLSGGDNRKAIRISKRFNPLAGTVSYDIEFTNDPKVLDGFMHEYTIEASKDSANITTIVQRGTVTPYKNKNKIFSGDPNAIFGVANFSNIASDLNNKIKFSEIEGEINDLYGQVMYDNNASLSEYQMITSSVSYPKWGIGISYSKTFSNDEAILDPAKNNGIKRLSLKYNNGAPTRIKSTHMIPNVKENVYDADQISLGERSISINAIVERDFGNTNRIGKGAQDKNSEKDAITFQRAKLNTGLGKIIKEAQVNLLFTKSKHIRPKSYDIYPTQCTYSINSDNQIEFSLGAEYVFKDGRQVKDLDSFFVKDK